jgi:hypothetical protein
MLSTKVVTSTKVASSNNENKGNIHKETGRKVAHSNMETVRIRRQKETIRKVKQRKCSQGMQLPTQIDCG